MMTVLHRRLARLLLALATALTMHGSWVHAGTTPPTLISLSASSPVHGGSNIILTAELRDNQSGVDETLIHAVLLDPQMGGQITVTDWRHQGGDTYTAEAHVGSSALPGNWRVHFLLAYDRNRNGAMFIYGTHHNVGFQVINAPPSPPPSDTTPPSLLSLSASSPVHAGEKVTVTAKVVDHGSGVNPNWLYAVLLDPRDGGQITIQDWTPHDHDIYVGEATIGPGALAGNWRIYYLLAYDRDRNGAMFFHGNHHQAGFQVLNPNPDGNPPVMSSVSVTPNPGTLNDLAAVTIAVTDDVTGVDPTNLFVNLTHESGLGHSQVNEWEMIGPDIYRGSTVLNPLGPPGAWMVHSIFLRDNAGNAASLLHGKDYTATFSVQHPAIPDIHRQPNNMQRPLGIPAAFSVAAVGAPPLSYQWRRNGVPIPGATATGYVHTATSDAEDGDAYDVIVSNANGSVTSRVATLRIGAGNYQGVIESQAPDVWYRLDNNLSDSGTGGGRALTFDGGKWGNGGTFGLDFEGYDRLAYFTASGQDLMYQPDNIIHNVGSISLLLKTPDVHLEGNRYVFWKGNSPSGFQLLFNEPNMVFRIGNQAITLPNGRPLQDQWYYFGASWDIPSGTVDWAYGPLGGSIQTGSRPVAIDANAGNDARPFFLANRDFRQWDNWSYRSKNGGLDEVAVWNRALSPDELVSQFAALTAPPGAVAVVTHPQSQEIPDGASVEFNTRVVGDEPIFYQWLRDGHPISGATNTRLRLTEVTQTDDGVQFSITASNAVGAATSLPATLTITPVRQYQATVLSHAPDYWFPLDGTLANFGTRPIDPLRSIFNRLPEGTDNIGNEQSAFEFPGGFDHIAQDTDMVHDQGSFSLLFRTPDLPFEGPNRHVFHFGGTAANGDAMLMRFAPGGLSLILGSVNTQLISGQPLQGAWYYFALTWDLNHPDGPQARWHLGPLDSPLDSGVIHLSPGDVLGTGGPLYFGNRNENEWDNALREGPDAPGTIDEIAFWSRELSLEEIQLQHASHATPYTAPTIVAQPADTGVGLGQPADFSVTAFGVGPLTYQWLSDGTAIPDATNATLTIAETTQAMDNRPYQVIVSDTYGSVTSSVAVLSIIPLYIETHPADQVVPEGATGHFSIQAFGQEPIRYQWMKNGAPLAGATNATLHLIGVSLADDGAQISVTASNALDTVTSQAATLTVTPTRLYQQTVLSHLPDYWFPLDNTLAGFGTKPIGDLTGTPPFTRGTDNVGTISNAFSLVGGFDHLAQATDMVHDQGSFSLLFQTPDLPFDGPNRHVFHFGGTPANGNAMLMRFAPGGLNLLLGSVNTQLIIGQPLQGTWYYFALTWDLNHPDGPQARWHLGPLDSPLDSGVIHLSPGDVLGTGGPLYFGNRSGTEWDNALRVGPEAPGTIDELAFWSRELSLDEIQLQHASHTVPYSGPTITEQPMDLTVDAFESAMFTVAAEGIGPLTHQWFSNGVVQAGATNAALVIPFVTVGMDQGEYAVRVSDNFGSATSSVAVLTVIPPPPNLGETIAALDPDYWFRFDGTYANSGISPAPDFNPTGVGFGVDAYGNPDSAVMMESATASLEQSDLIGSSGTMTLLFRAPDEPLQFAHLFAQGTSTNTLNAFNVFHVEFTGLRLRVGDANALIHPGVLPVSRWYFLALSWDESRVADHVRWWLGPVGGAINKGTVTLGAGAVIGDGGSWILGNNSVGGFSPWRRDNGTGHPGSLDEVALWNTELTAASVSNLISSATVGGPNVTVIIGRDLRNGNYNADTSTVDSRNFNQTPFWQNIGTSAPDQSAVATRTTLDFDGTRNAQITDNESVLFGMDTQYIVSEGDLFDVRYVWRDAFNWHAPSDRIAVRLFITEDDTISGKRTDLATSLSSLSSQSASWEPFEHTGFYTASSSVAGKRLFVEINGADGNGNPNGFARLDNFEMMATTAGHGGHAASAIGASSTPPTITQMRFTTNAAGQWGFELGFETQPSRSYTIECKDNHTSDEWQTAVTITAVGAETRWHTADTPTAPSLPSGKTRTYRVIEVP